MEEYMMKKIYIVIIILAVLILGITSGIGLYNRGMLVLVNHPTIEINSEFHYKKYIKEVKKGKKSDVACDMKKLNTAKLGNYEVIYIYKGHQFPMTIQVVDTIKPQIKLSTLTVLINTTPDLKKDVEISDNSGLQPKLTIDSSKLNTSQEGKYVVRYKVKDKSGNTTIKDRVIKVVKEYGTSEQSDEKIVYLTFDDGPSQNTQKILNILERYHAKATFFVTGHAPKYNSYIKEAYEKGHTIGLHSYCHEYDMIYSSVEAYFQDFVKIGDMVEDIIGIRPHYMRFPGGSSNKISMKYKKGIMSVLTQEVLKRGYQYYDWNCGTGDAEGHHVPVEKIIQNATIKNDNNIVMLAHDTDEKNTTVQALPSIIEYYQNKGYEFKAIDDESFYAHQNINN